jgi:hypothetical protein
MQSDNFLNLTPPRAEIDAWKHRGSWSGDMSAPVASWLLSVAGVSLLACGAYRARRSGGGMWWIASGAILCGWAAASAGRRYWGSGVRSLEQEFPGDVVTQESFDSFPASDAPSSNATTASPQPLSAGTR